MTTCPTSVLVAVDFSEASARAVSLAAAIAHGCHAGALRLLHAEALEAPLYFTHDQMQALERQRQQTRAQAEQYLRRFGRQHAPEPFTVTVDDRAPVDAILHEAASADLVVMGTHGRRGARRWWLGSVAERVLRDIDRSLLIVHAGPATADHAFDRLLVHASAAAAGGPAFAYAQALGGCFSSHVVDGPGWPLAEGLATARPTLLVAAAPSPRTSVWLSDYGEPLVRSCAIPMLFVPEAPATP